MLAKLFTYSLFGIEARAVEVEVDISSGSLPRTIFGRAGRGGGSREHAPDRASAGQQRLRSSQ
ncbi:MAG: hypothetical protein CM1200mP2_26530 [Planctomycetaceae bacterium]|nr:MAG: hypothetical protein CM1200mP2_26530 [Planctomycetaceae bacterium]